MPGQDRHPKIVITNPLANVIGWVIILAMFLLFLFAVVEITSGDTGAAVLIAVVPVGILAGIWLAGYKSTIRFDAESMTVTRGHVPLFVWWSRYQTVSKESARTAVVTSHRIFTDMTEYWVDVETPSGESLPVFKWESSDEAEYLLDRMKRWCG
jgi:hypothetical protein